MLDMEKRVGIVHPFANLDSIPSLVNTAVLLAGAGYRVDIFTSFDTIHLAPEFEDRRIDVLPLEVPRAGRRRFPWCLPSARLYRRLQLTVRHRKAPYVCFIGVDAEGLIEAYAMAGVVGVPVAYYSLELLLSYELKTDEDRLRKERESILSREAAFVIIQDEERASLLIRDNKIDPGRIIHVPNAPLGKAERRRSSFLRKKFDLSADKKIILSTGDIRPWTGMLYVIRSTHDWPDNWVLICHSRREVNHPLYRAYMKALEFFAKPGCLLFSTSPLAREDYPELVRSADIGLAYYTPHDGSVYTQDNIKHLGLSSGKMAYCLQAGIPTVANDATSLADVVRESGCGEVCQDPGVTVRAISRILNDYDTYSENALRCFNEKFDFAGKFETVLQELQGMSSC